MKENKKIVNAVSKAVTKGVHEMERLKGKSKKAVTAIKKEWVASEPQRKNFRARADKMIEKVEKKSAQLIKNSLQLKKDITKGVKLGIRNSKKK